MKTQNTFSLWAECPAWAWTHPFLFEYLSLQLLAWFEMNIKLLIIAKPAGMDGYWNEIVVVYLQS